MKDYISNNEALDLAASTVYKRLHTLSEANPSLIPVSSIFIHFYFQIVCKQAFPSDTVKLRALLKLRKHLLFLNDHPIVLEDLARFQEAGNHATKTTNHNLDWDAEPEETHPKWLKKHWKMMQKLKA